MTDVEGRLRGVEQSIATLFERQSQSHQAITSRLDSVIAAVKDEHGTVLTRQDKTNGEVAQLKLWQNRVIGGMGVVVLMMGAFGVYVLERL